MFTKISAKIDITLSYSENIPVKSGEPLVAVCTRVKALRSDIFLSGGRPDLLLK